MLVERTGRIGGYTAKTTRKGVVIDQWSRSNGAITNARWHVSKRDVRRYLGADARIDSEAIHRLAVAALCGAIPARSLRRGFVVR
jgi:hypothetical protein